MPVATYRRKPSHVRAVHWTGDNLSELQEFAGDALFVMQEGIPGVPANIGVRTANGSVSIEIGSWLATRLPVGSADFYPIVDSEFHTLYELDDGS